MSAVATLAAFTALGAGWWLANLGATLGGPYKLTLWTNLEPFVYWYVCGLFAPFLFFVVKRYPPARTNVRATVLRYAGAVGLASAAQTAIMFAVNIRFSHTIAAAWRWELLHLFMKAPFFLCATMVAAVAIQYHRGVTQTRLRRASLEASLARAQYEIINNQVHPHFLFNTLNAIAALSRENPAATERMSLLLRDFLRVATEKRNVQEVTLFEEARLLEMYVGIMRLRFSESLKITINIPHQLQSALVPHFLLQPLVENALKYAVDDDGQMEVAVTAWNEASTIGVRVADRGIHLLSDRPLGTGHGLEALRRRLTHLYRGAASCTIRNRVDDRGVEVIILLPRERPVHAASA